MLSLPDVTEFDFLCNLQVESLSFPAVVDFFCSLQVVTLSFSDAADFFCSLPVDTDSSSSLRDKRYSGVDMICRFFNLTLRGCGTGSGGTYGRLSDSSTEVNKRIAEPLLGCPVGVVLFSSPYAGRPEYSGGCVGVLGRCILFCS